MRSARLLALFALGGLLFNLPLLAVWDRDVRVWGIPLLPWAVFVGWGALIALAAWVLESGSD